MVIVQAGLGLAQQLEKLYLNADPPAERSRKFKKQLEICLASPYRTL